MTADNTIPKAQPEEIAPPYYRMRDTANSNLLEPDYLIKGLLPRRALACVWGGPGAGKTFWVIAANIAVSAKEIDSFHGARVRHSNTLYCALEGSAGINKRLRPYMDRYGDCGLHIFDGALDLRSTGEDADRVIEMAHRIGNVGLITIDTMNRALAGGNENSPDDMGAFINSCQQIIRETGATVLVVHHPGKDDSKGMRGHSSWHGAVDTSIEVKDFNGARRLTLRKQKDGVAGVEYGFQLDPFPIGVDDDGDEVSTCSVRTIEPPAAKSGRLSDRQKVVLDCAYEAIKKHGERPSPDLADNNPGVLKCVPAGTLRDLAYARTYLDIMDDSRRKAFRRDIEKLSGLGRVKLWHDYVFIPAGQAGQGGTKP